MTLAMTPSPCISDEQMLRLSDEEALPAEEMATIRQHVLGCAPCLTLVRALLLRSSAAPEVLPPRLSWPRFTADDLIAGRYRIKRFLAKGGMGEVYEAYDQELGIAVALKTILPAIDADQETLARFKREVLLARQVSHPNVCRIFDLGVHQQQDAGGSRLIHFLTMELLAGSTLTQLIQERAPQDVAAKVLMLLRQMALALDAAHQAGVVHRDFKPDNVFIIPTAQGDERVVVTDFGLARTQGVPPDSSVASSGGALVGSTQVGILVGTPLYMSPEQCRCEREVGPKTDVYSLGVVLYQVVSGRPPFFSAHLRDVLAMHVGDEPPPLLVSPPVPIALGALARRMLAKVPDERPTMAQVAAELAEMTRPRARRRWVQRVAAAALAVLTLAVLGDTYLVRRTRAPGAAGGQRMVVAKSRRAVAVLGFANVAMRADAAWLSAALTEVLNATLASGGELRLIPRDAGMRMRQNLLLSDDALSGPEVPLRVRRHLGADLVVLGSYVAAGGTVQINLQLKDATTGTLVAALTDRGSEEHLSEVASRLAEELRSRLGLGQLSAEQRRTGRAALPANLEAARAYVGGLLSLTAHELPAALDLLRRAQNLSPLDPHLNHALGELWELLGDEEKLREHTQRAFENAAALSPEERLLLEARYRIGRKEYDKAVEVESRLFDTFPDNLGYGLKLAESQLAAERDTEALATLARLRGLPTPDGDDPWIDIWKSLAEEASSDLGAAVRSAQRAAQAGAARGDRLVLAAARLNEGWALYAAGEYPAALAAFQEARDRYAALGDKLQEAWCLDGIGLARRQRGALREALAAHEAEVALFRVNGHQSGVAWGLHHTAAPLWKLGRLTLARSRAEEALALSRQVGFRGGIGPALSYLADILFAAGRLVDGERVNREASRWFAINDKAGAARSVFILGKGLAAKGEIAPARAEMARALELFLKAGRRADAASSQRWLAGLERELGHLREAEVLAREALAEFQREESVDEEALTRATLAEVLLLQGQTAAASGELARAAQLSENSQDVPVRVAVQMAQARIHLAAGRPADLATARAMARSALAAASQGGFVPEQLEARMILGQIEIKSGHAGAGLAMLRTLEEDAIQGGFLLIARRTRGLRGATPTSPGRRGLAGR